MTSPGKIIIIGAGTVGSHISYLLARENHEVVVIDSDPARLDRLSNTLDVQTLCGHGGDPSVLLKAGVEGAQLVLAMTNDDETNLLCGFTAKQLGAQMCVVRTRSPWYLDRSVIDLHQKLGIDRILNPEELTALEIVRFLTDPDALALARFAHGKVQLRTVTLDADSSFVGKQVKDCRMPEGTLLAALSHEGKVEIPRGDTVLNEGAKVTIIGKPEVLGEAQRLMHAPTGSIHSVTIGGGGITGLFLAEMLQVRDFAVKLIEADAERCEYLSERLDNVQIIHGDITDLGVLKEERVANANVFISVSGDDENNLMACLLASELGVKQTVANIARPAYANVVGKFGISLAVSPRHVIAERILTMVGRGKVQAVTLLENGKVEVVELVAGHGSAFVGKPLAELKIPEGGLIATIVHLGKVTVPRGQHVIEPGDTVIAVGLARAMDKIEAGFQGQ